MTAIEKLADLITRPVDAFPNEVLAASNRAFGDTVACMFAGAEQASTQSVRKAAQMWGNGTAIAIAQGCSLGAPFAAMVNATAAHALDYDDYDAPANSHPSAVIFPALLAMPHAADYSGHDLLDAHIFGVEIVARLGEAMNMAHYLKGWHTTVTLGSVAAAGACARFAGYDRETCVSALSLACSMSSAMTNQSGFSAKQVHAGLAAKNGLMAAQLAASGVSASANVLDGPVSLARSMGDYDQDKFDTALSKLGEPWAIAEYGLIAKAYPSCGYTHRLVDAAMSLVSDHAIDSQSISQVTMGVPDYYLDLLVYDVPANRSQAMFSAHYNVASVLRFGRYDLSTLDDSSLFDEEIVRLCQCARIETRRALDTDVIYDPRDPDWVRLDLVDGRQIRAQAALPTGAPDKPMTIKQQHNKFDTCTQTKLGPTQRDALWSELQDVSAIDRIKRLLSLLR